MKVLCDFHHEGLYYSLQLLFEKRLGFEFYKQIGLDWQTNGFWNVFPHPATAQQYLGLHNALTEPELKCINTNYIIENEIFYVKDHSQKDNIQAAVTLDYFKENKFDILICSMPNHIEPFKKLIKLYQPQAKLIFQMGNNWNNTFGVKNILSSIAPFYIQDKNVNIVNYHQEFDLDLFKYIPPINHHQVNSYIHYMQEVNVLNDYASTLSNDWKFNCYGCDMKDGSLIQEDIAQAYINSGWTWNIKPGGDGYGHTIYNSAACGRPFVIKLNYLKGCHALELMEDGVTCVDISKRSIHDNCILLNQLSRPDNHIKMCDNMYKRFKECVDFDYDEQLVRKFISNLI